MSSPDVTQDTQISQAQEIGMSLVDRLYAESLDAFSLLSRNYESTEMPIEDKGHFQEEAGRFYLWGQHVRDGEIDAILRYSPDLYHTIVKFCSIIARVLASCMSSCRF